MKPYYEQDGIRIYHADWHDCIEVMRGFPDAVVDAVVTDPPYGMQWDVDTSRFGGGDATRLARRGVRHNIGSPVAGDDRPFDPNPWLAYHQVILWGSNHFASRLPEGTTLVWIKRLDGAYGSFLSDAEVAWMKGGHGVYCRRDLSLMGETRRRYHPTQKPVPLMAWCIEKTTGVVLDPFMGSGTTLVAAKQLGRKAIGIEIEERYCEIAAQRLAQGVLSLTT